MKSNSKFIYQDTREKPNAIGKINKQLEEAGYKIIRSKLYVGDYQLLDNPHITIDRKQNLQEVCQNLTHDHVRFKDECKRAMELGIKFIVLVEHGGDIKRLEDVMNWYNPRLKHSPKATKGITLYKIMFAFQENYKVHWEFCKKGETGKRIIELLEGKANETK